LRSAPSIIYSGEHLGSIQVSLRILRASYWVLGAAVGSPHHRPPSAAIVVLTRASSGDQKLAPTLPSGVVWSPASNTHNRASNCGLNHRICDQLWGEMVGWRHDCHVIHSDRGQPPTWLLTRPGPISQWLWLGLEPVRKVSLLIRNSRK
jgi:hypothetical protein